MLIRTIKFYILVTVFVSCTVKANIFYVQGSNSSDTNPGTFNLPFKTIQRAADVAVAGDTVYIRQGVYREGFSTVNSGNSAQGSIVFSAYNAEQIILDG